MNLIIAILGFGFLIFIHELGHFALAKINGVGVDEFSIGMGPKVFSYTCKETAYSLRAFPFGGFVSMVGEEESSSDENSFSEKSPFRRFTIIIAGVVMNFILAVVLFSVCIYNQGYGSTVIKSVEKDSVLSAYGIVSGDKIVAINDMTINTVSDLGMALTLAKDKECDITVDRSGELLSFDMSEITKNNDSPVTNLNITLEFKDSPTIIESVVQGYKNTISMIRQVFISLKLMITGQVNFKTDVTGPIGLVKMTTEKVNAGVWEFLNFLAFISANLAVMNVLPFPALDGGWAVMILFEMITKKKVPEKFVGIVNAIGFAILMLLMIIVVVKDIIFPIAM